MALVCANCGDMSETAYCDECWQRKQARDAKEAELAKLRDENQRLRHWYSYLRKLIERREYDEEYELASLVHSVVVKALEGE